MIDEIVQLILKEARDYDNPDYLESLYKVWDPIRHKIHSEMVDATLKKRKQKQTLRFRPDR